jgi:hypothetical protein
MGDNASGWDTDAPKQVGYRAGYQFWTPAQAMGAQFAQAKPEGAVATIHPGPWGGAFGGLDRR